MFAFAVLIGIYSYLIFSIGLLGFLNSKIISVFSIAYFFLSFYFLKKYEFLKFKVSGKILNNRLVLLILLVLTLQIIANFIGVLGPELSFDALWYHLTLPKLYILNNTITYIPGGLLYYSAMPKLTEMLYTAGLLFGNEVIPKMISFSFGILICITMYSISRKFLNQSHSFLAVIIFYSNLIVGWQSVTSYIDLARTFFEVIALWGFINFWEKGEKKWLTQSAIMLGLAIATKLLAFSSLFIFTLFIFYRYFNKKHKNYRRITTSILKYWCLAILIPSPWLVFSFVHTGNPVYPFFTDIYPVGLSTGLFNPINFIKEMWFFFTNLSDPISPLYLIFLPFVIVYFRKLNSVLKIISIYSVLAVIIWYFTPRTGGGRFILPYLPAFSILVSGTINKLIKNKYLYKFSLILVFITAFISIGYRGIANSKYIPVILGQQSKANFLENHLNFSFGDFYDTDWYFKNNIRKTDKVLLYGFHNLYYVNFPFIDSSWVKKGDTFNYIAVQDSDIPERFLDWDLVYSNPTTKVMLYSKGDIKWTY